MDLVRSWLAATVVLVALAAGTSLIAILTLSPDWLSGPLGGAIWAGGAAFVTYALTAAAAGLAHRVRRPGPRRKALAVLLVPALAIVASLVVAVARGAALPVTASETVLGIAGVAVGWVALRALDGRRGTRTGGGVQAAYRY